MKRFFCFFLSLLLSMQQGSAQKSLLRLFGTDTGYLYLRAVDPVNKMIPFAKELNCSDARHHYFLKNGELYVQLDGSGKLFVWDNLARQPRRLDATCYEGYNFGAYSFIRNNRFYSLGGWGFWQFNGGLRYYSEQLKEWSVIPLNKEVPFSQIINAFVYEDNRAGLVYVAYLPYPNSYVQNKRDNVGDSMLVQCLDLNTNSWWDKPKLLSPGLQAKTLGFAPILLPGIGLILPAKEYLSLLDFKNNRLYKLNTGFAEQILDAQVKNKNGFYVVKDSSMFYYNPTTDSITTLRLSRTDLVTTDIPPLKTLPEPFRPKLIWGIVVTAILLFTAGFTGLLYLHQRKRMQTLQLALSQSQKLGREVMVDKDTPFSDNLTSQERSVLELLIHKSNQDLPTSIDEINRVLGVKNKDVSIQNKLRSDTLQMINRKFRVYAASQDTLVEREKTELDKRVYQYRVNERYLNKIK